MEQLSANSGLPPASTIAQLRAQHQTPNSFMGINGRAGSIGGIFKLFRHISLTEALIWTFCKSIRPAKSCMQYLPTLFKLQRLSYELMLSSKLLLLRHHNSYLLVRINKIESTSVFVSEAKFYCNSMEMTLQVVLGKLALVFAFSLQSHKNELAHLCSRDQSQSML